MDFFSVHDGHSVLLLIGLALFPRITMLFVGGPFGVLAWLGWFFVPHFTVALFATFRYWETNPFLVAVGWFCALSFSGAESSTAVRVSRRRSHRED